MANGNSVQPGSDQPASILQKTREWLSLVVICLALLSIFCLALMMLWVDVTNEHKLELYKYVFTALVPLLASWVGTILAFYFSKENLSAATQSVTALAKSLSGVERLGTIAVKEKMRPIAQIKSKTVPTGDEDKTKLTDLLNAFATLERILILDTSSAVRYLIYRAQINAYLSELALGSNPPALPSLTLKELLSDQKRATLFTTSFAFVPETATLADAKVAMDKVNGCNDVFVTHSGGKSEPLLGWVTDNTIIENSRV